MMISPETMNNDVYRTLIEKMNQPISIIQLIFNEIGDPIDYITLYMNPAAETELGLKREETIGRRAKEIRPNAEQEWFARYGEAAKTGISASFEMHSSAFNRYYNDQVIPLGNDKIGIIFQDITELKDKEEAERNAIEALRESEEKYRNIFETAQEGIWIINGNNQTILVNEKLQQMLGYTLDELLGQPPHAYMDPEFQAVANYRLAEHMEGIKHVIDYRFIKKDGSSLWCILSTTPLFDKEGKFDGSIVMLTDITDRKRAEEERELLLSCIGEEKQLLESILGSMDDEVWFCDTTGKVTLMNQAAKTGLALDAVDGKKFIDIVNVLEILEPDGNPRSPENTPLDRALKGETVRGEEYIRHQETGELKYRSYIAEPVRNYAGQIIGSIAVSRDITERKKVEKSLRESEERLLALTRATSDSIYRMSPDWKTITELYGPGFLEDIKGLVTEGLDKYIHPDDQPFVTSVINECIREKKILELEHRFLKEDGEIGWMFSRAVPIFDDNRNITEWIEVVSDITEHKRIVEEYKKSEERFRIAQEISPDGFSILDPVRDEKGSIVDFTWVYANYAIARLNGTDPQLIIGQRLLELLPSHRGTPILEAYIQVAETGETCIFEAEYSLESMLKPTWFRMVIVRINRVIAILSQDITKRVLAEEALLESEKNLKALISELEKSDLNKTKFINILSHELRNPLASIMMSLELLEKVPPGGKQAVMALSIAKRQGKQLTNLVDDLLDVTRITQNKIALKKETLEINDLIDKAVQDYQSQFVDKNVKLEVNLTTPLYIEADYSRLTQVISNLLHNAAKFTDKNDLVMVSVTEDTNTEVVITVQDTGRGMDSKDQLNLFEPFMQVDKSLDRSLGGLGLGLSIVKGMVELHGGRVEAFSEGIGKGTEFTIRLPI